MLVLLICTDMKVFLVIGSEIEWGFLMPLFSFPRGLLSPPLSLSLPKSVTIATRQKHQLSPLPLHLVLNGAKIDQVSEHRLLGITIDNKLRWEWDSHTNNVCKTVSRRVFLLSKLRYIVDIDTRKLFFKAHIKPHIG